MARHGFIPDPLVENDASPCEICGDMFTPRHDDYALYVKETDKERIRLEGKLKAATEALGLMPYRVREMYDAETESGIDPASTAAGLMLLVHDLSNNALENIRNMVAE